MSAKLRMTVISAALTALDGAIYGQYPMHLNPETVSGIAPTYAMKAHSGSAA
jgi:branched-chain amino acid transport system permease protein